MERNVSKVGTAVVTLLVFFVLFLTGSSLALARPLKHKPPMVTISGTLEETDRKFVLKNPKRTLEVTGQDFTPFVGKKVRATGRITKTGGGPQIFDVAKIHHTSRKGR